MSATPAATTVTTPAGDRAGWLNKNRGRLAVLAVLVFLFVAAVAGLERDAWLETIMRALSIGALTFLVASGLSLILGLMDVFNLAHGELFMLGAYLGWTAYTRPDTLLDFAVPALLVAAPFTLSPLWRRLAHLLGSGRRRTAVGWVLLAGGGTAVALTITRFPLVIWNPEEFTRTPANFSLQIDLGTLAPLPSDSFDGSPVLAVLGVVLGGALVALGLATLSARGRPAAPLRRRHLGGFAGLVVAAVGLHLLKGTFNTWLFGMSTTWRFFVSMAVAVLLVAALGALFEIILIRPLYDRPIYQLMLTLGVGFVIIELVRELWGRPEFTMARPAAFNGTGPGCPAEGFGGFFSGCSTVDVAGGRLRVYNEGFIVLVGLVILVAGTIVLRRSRLGMVIRAGVEHPDMVNALGINVRRVFTLVFAIGSGLAALGGVLAAPSVGLSPGMGAVLLLGAIVALAVGGLTSFAGSALGAVVVGLLQQLIIRFGQTGIDLPLLGDPWKPSPTVVPAASVLLMVIILLVLPTGLLGRTEK